MNKKMLISGVGIIIAGVGAGVITPLIRKNDNVFLNGGTNNTDNHIYEKDRIKQLLEMTLKSIPAELTNKEGLTFDNPTPSYPKLDYIYKEDDINKALELATNIKFKAEKYNLLFIQSLNIAKLASMKISYNAIVIPAEETDKQGYTFDNPIPSYPIFKKKNIDKITNYVEMEKVLNIKTNVYKNALAYNLAFKNKVNLAKQLAPLFMKYKNIIIPVEETDKQGYTFDNPTPAYPSYTKVDVTHLTSISELNNAISEAIQAKTKAEAYNNAFEALLKPFILKTLVDKYNKILIPVEATDKQGLTFDNPTPAYPTFTKVDVSHLTSISELNNAIAKATQAKNEAETYNNAFIDKAHNVKLSELKANYQSIIIPVEATDKQGLTFDNPAPAYPSYTKVDVSQFITEAQINNAIAEATQAKTKAEAYNSAFKANLDIAMIAKLKTDYNDIIIPVEETDKQGYTFDNPTPAYPSYTKVDVTHLTSISELNNDITEATQAKTKAEAYNNAFKNSLNSAISKIEDLRKQFNSIKLPTKLKNTSGITINQIDNIDGTHWPTTKENDYVVYEAMISNIDTEKDKDKIEEAIKQGNKVKNDMEAYNNALSKKINALLALKTNLQSIVIPAEETDKQGTTFTLSLAYPSYTKVDVSHLTTEAQLNNAITEATSARANALAYNSAFIAKVNSLLKGIIQADFDGMIKDIEDHTTSVGASMYKIPSLPEADSNFGTEVWDTHKWDVEKQMEINWKLTNSKYFNIFKSSDVTKTWINSKGSYDGFSGSGIEIVYNIVYKKNGYTFEKEITLHITKTSDGNSFTIPTGAYRIDTKTHI